MKKIFLFLIMMPLAATAQDAASLKAETKKMFDATNNLEIEKILDMSYPKLFTIAPREEMKTAILQTFTPNDQFSLKLLPIEPNFEYGEIRKIGVQTFSIIRYDMGMEMKFTKEMGDPTMIAGMMKQQMGAEKVDYDAEKKAIIVAKRSILLAVADDSTKGDWKFLNYDTSGAEVFDALFSADVRKQLGL